MSADSLDRVIAEMRQPENSGQFGPWQVTRDNIANWADRLQSLRPAGGGEARVQLTAPERIYLTVSDDTYDESQPFPDDSAWEHICWSVDQPVSVCVPYVRADLRPAGSPSSAALVGLSKETVSAVLSEVLDEGGDSISACAFDEIVSRLTAAEAQGDDPLCAWVGDMKTSAGMDYYVCVGRKGGGLLSRGYITPNKYSIRGRAEYDVARWNHLLNGGPEPDILAFDTDAAASAGAEQEAGHD